MFDFVRSHSKLMLALIVLLIIPSFVFFGVQGYTNMTEGNAATVAKVDGQAITRGEWDYAHQRNVERVRAQSPSIDVRLLDTPERKRETLEGLLRERVLLAAANRQFLFPSEAKVAKVFRSDPQFDQMRNPDGTVNKDILAAQGMTSQTFVQQLQVEYGMRQVLGGVGATSVAPTGVAAPSLTALLQQREIQLQRFHASDYLSKVAPTEADLQAYYQAHASEFSAPETTRIEYVVLDLDALSRDLSVPEADLRRYYDENASRYTVAEERRARHILIKLAPDAAKADEDKATAKAEDLLAQARRNPKGFAELARKHSDDGSAQQGGDLDFFGRGMMVKPFEDVAFAMKPGEISEVVRTDFGLHIIQLSDVRGGTRQPFDKLRADIEAEVRRSLAQRRYAEAAEQFTNTAYEQPDSLEPLAERFKLERRSATVQRTPQPGAVGPLASAKLLEAVFSDDALRDKRNTDAVETGTNELVSARVVSHQPARTLALDEVRDQVRQQVIAEKAAALAAQDGQQRLQALKDDPALALPQTLTVSRSQLKGQPVEVLMAALKQPQGELPAAVGVDLGREGYAVMRVVRVVPLPDQKAAINALRGRYAQAWAEVETRALYVALKNRHKAQIKTEVVEAALAQPNP